MSRSRRKTKIFGITTARSEKEDKVLNHRRIRRSVAESIRKSVRTGDEPPSFDKNDGVQIWSWAKDGKTYFGEATEKDMRK